MWGALKWESLTRDRPITHRFPSGFAVYPPAPPHGVSARANLRSALLENNKGVRRLAPAFVRESDDCNLLHGRMVDQA